MLDIQLLRNDLDGIAKRLAQRGYTFDATSFQALEQERKSIQTQTQDLQSRRNQLSRQIGQLKAKGEDAIELMAQVNAQADGLKALEQKLNDVQARLNDFIRVVPNVPHESVPQGGSVRRECRGASGRHAAHVRFSGQGSRRHRCRPRNARLRRRCEDRGRAFFSAERTACTTAPRPRAVHARCAHHRARLYGSVCAVHGECRERGRCVESGEVQGRSVQDRRPRSLSHSDGRIPGDESRTRRDPASVSTAAQVRLPLALLPQ